MSFLKIKDPLKRDQIVKEYLATKKRIRDSQLAERTGEIELQTDLSKFFKPITETQKEATKEITEGLKPIKEGMKDLPKALHFQPFLLSKLMRNRKLILKKNMKNYLDGLKSWKKKKKKENHYCLLDHLQQHN